MAELTSDKALSPTVSESDQPSLNMLQNEENTVSKISNITTSANSSSTNTAAKGKTSSSSSSSKTAAAAAKAAAIALAYSKFPIRVGITWQKGEKLEAMDYSQTWYPSKIIEIDHHDNYVLIHFEGWNQRYDEWFPMNSEKLRPVTRHSERKDKRGKKRQYPHPVSDTPTIFRAGERVLAKWSDCKKYPGKINRLLEDGSYEVIFYDGITQPIQPINIQPLTKEMQEGQQVEKAPPRDHLKPPQTLMSTFKNISLKLPESVTSRLTTSSYSRSKHSGTKKLSKHVTSPFKKTKKTDAKYKSRQQKSWQSSMPDGSSRLQIRVKRVSISESELSTASSMSGSMTVAPSTPAVQEDSLSRPAVDAVQVTAEREVKDNDDLSKLDTSLAPRDAGHVSSCFSKSGMKKSRKRHRVGTGLDMKQKKRTKHKSVGDDAVPKKRAIPALGESVRSTSVDTGLNQAPPVPPAVMPLGYAFEPFVPTKAFVVEEDHNPHKCPYVGCNKGFRKENLLIAHIKYYHRDAEINRHPAAVSITTASSSSSVVTPTSASSVTTLPSVEGLLPPSTIGMVQSPGIPSGHVRKRRKKTSSICSTDSDLSVSSSKGKSSKRRRHDSEISVTTASPDVAGRDMWADIRQRASQEDSVECQEVCTDDVEEAEVEAEADLVNCSCGVRQTGGLMIQCDVCMCWQHFACVDTGGLGEPPLNYVCSICENTPGVRDSCRHMHDMGWERRGELPSFSFTSESSPVHLKSMACECNDLIASLQNIKSVLHSTRRQIKISKEEDDPEFQLWQTDWDHWVKPEEEILTPHSVDPAPSPTPSTFLFPPARTSSASALAPSDVKVEHSDAPSEQGPLSVTTNAISTSSSSSVVSPVAPLTSPPHLESSLNSPSATNISVSTSHRPLNPQVLDSNSLTPPLSGVRQHEPTPHPTPSSVRSGSGRLPSILGRAGGLVRDLFPGPAGDASSMSSLPLHNGHENDTSLHHQGLDTTQERLDDRQETHTRDTQSSKEQENTNPRPPTVSTLSSDRDTQASGNSSTIISTLPLQQSKASASPADAEQTQVTPGDIVNNATDHGQDLLLNGNLRDEPGVEFTVKQSQDNQQDGQAVSREPEPRISSSLYLEIADEGTVPNLNGFDDDKDDNDTDTAEESAEPYKHCERNLLIHVTNVHSEIEKHLETLERQIADLENSEHSRPQYQLTDDNVLNDVPDMRKSLNKLCQNLAKVHRLSTCS